MVETITRVIHVESEEEGSASTGGGGHGQNLKELRPRTGRSSSPRKHHGVDRRTVYGGKFEAEPSGHRRERIFSPKRVAYETRNPGRDYNAHDKKGSDSSQSFESRTTLIQNKRADEERNEAPQRGVIIFCKKRLKRNQSPTNRKRFHTSQPSMLESLH